MIKKILFSITILTMLIFIVACNDNKPEEEKFYLPDLIDKTETEINQIIEPLPITVTFTYEDSNSVSEGKFIRYVGATAGDEIIKNITYQVVIARNYPVLPDLTGLSKAEIEVLLTSLNISYQFEYALNDEVEADHFDQFITSHTQGQKIPFQTVVGIQIALNSPELPDLTSKTEQEVRQSLTELRIQFRIQYIKNNTILAGLFDSYRDKEAGDKVTASEFVVVYIATNDPKLPNLNNRSEAYIINQLQTLGIEYEINYVLDNNILAGRFSHYDGYVAGDFISEKVTVNIAINDPKLPDLTGLDKQEMETLLDQLGIQYTFEYQSSETIELDHFISVDSFNVGDFISAQTVINIKIATDEVVLPALDGLTETEITTLLTSLGLTFTFEVETNNSVEDMTFSRFENHVAGEFVSKTELITIYIGFNDPVLPDLSNKNIIQIGRILDELYIQYTFSYIINDDFEEDSFAYYVDYEAGDFISTDATVEVVLYKNTFTSNEMSLFISKVVENDTNNSAVEIYNPFDYAVDLGDYHIVIYSNGAITPTYMIQLTGQLLPEQTFVIVKSNASETLKAYADLLSEWLVFDGNDVIQLRYKNNTYIDTISQIGTQTFVMRDEVFVRGTHVTGGTRSFSLKEWDEYIPSYYDVLGSHPLERPSMMVMDRTLLNNTFGDPNVSGMIIVTLAGINDGDTASFNPGFTGGQRVRFLGIDTPETFPTVDPGGLEAKNFTTQRLNAATEIILQSDPDLGSSDTFGRTLAYIWVDGVLLNYELVYYGHSMNYIGTQSRMVFANRYIHRWFQDAEDHAKDNNLGIWGL